MNTVILLSHILIASALTLTTFIVAFAALNQRPTGAYLPMLITFVATVLSGVALLFTVGSIGRVCATMAAVSLVVGIVHRYYKVRVLSHTV